jgi:hypothetical protein
MRILDQQSDDQLLKKDSAPLNELILLKAKLLLTELITITHTFTHTVIINSTVYKIINCKDSVLHTDVFLIVFH